MIVKKNKLNSLQDLKAAENNPTAPKTIYLEKNKEVVLKTLKIFPKTQNVKKETSDSVFENNILKIKNYLNEMNQRLKKVFDDSTKEAFTNWYKNLEDIEKKEFKEWFHKALVNYVNDRWINVSYAKYWKQMTKEFIPESNLLKTKTSEKDWYLRWDEIVVYIIKKNDGSLSLTETDPKLLKLRKFNWLEKIDYMPDHAKAPFEGKIIGPSHDLRRKEVIFKTVGGNQFSLWVDTLLAGIKKAEKFKNEKFSEENKNQPKSKYRKIA